MLLNRTLRFTRRNLPHWEVESGRYFVTVRCADSLPSVAIARLQEMHETVSGIEPRSEAFAEMQRRYFFSLEKYLDRGAGSCPLSNPHCAQLVVDELRSLAEWEIAVPHFSIMSNHWHALFVFPPGTPHTLTAVMKRIKGRTGKSIRSILYGRGAIWQREWFDRWIRDDAEWTKCVDYIRNNPVKAGLASIWHEHLWTR